MVADECPVCGSRNFIRAGVEVVCRRCGCVVWREEVDACPEWRGRTWRTTESRVGSPGMPLKLDKSDRTLASGIMHILTFGDTLRVPRSVVERAAEILREARASGLMRGRSVRELSAASTYLAARELGMPISLNELIKKTGIGRRAIVRSSKLLIEELGIRPSRISADAFLTRFSKELNLDPEVVRMARRMLRAMEGMKSLSGRSPRTLAATAIYLATLTSSTDATLREVAEMTGVTHQAIMDTISAITIETGIENMEGIARSLLKLTAQGAG